MEKILFNRQSFLTASSGSVTLDLKGYRYLSILTDGAINPGNNYLSDPFSEGSCNINSSLCYLKFDDDMRLNINGEIRNFRIDKYTLAKWYNEVPPQLCVGSSLQGGYGNLHFVLSVDPIDFILEKRNPYYFEKFTLGAAESKDYWLGAWSPLVYNLMIPWIPPGVFNTVTVWLWSSPFGDLDTQLYMYPSEPMSDGTLSTACSQRGIVGSGSYLRGNRFVCSGMTRMRLCFNNDLGLDDCDIEFVITLDKGQMARDTNVDP